MWFQGFVQNRGKREDWEGKRRVVLSAYSMISARFGPTFDRFPTVNNPVTVQFDASDTPLAGFNGDVYAHTGVTTDQSVARAAPDGDE